MEKYPHLKSAPITEALFDIRVSLPPEFDVEVFLKLKATLEKMGYPKIEKSWELTTGMSFNQEKSSVSHDRVLKGYWFTTDNRSAIVQFRKDGFTYNKLKPYTSWGDIKESAKKAWAVYKEIIGSPQVVRLGARYINHIELPLPLKNMSEYFLMMPDMKGRENRPLTGFMQKTVLQEIEVGAESMITFASQPSDKAGYIKILFDIDIYKAMAGTVVEDSDIWNTLNNFRDIKNRLFFKNVTEKTIETYK